ncbi:MAG TPA: hypothetical protein VHZ03_30575 [Trebonia sp.]|nr:hypothetical protein [Trebonia sp.]
MDGRELRRRLDVHEKIARVYADDRFPKSFKSPDVRTFTITVLWVVGIERPAPDDTWKRVYDILHLDDFGFWQTIAQDAPRYEPPREAQYSRQCEAPMIRRDGLCEKYASNTTRVTNPADGTWRVAAFCTRHDEQCRQVRNAERARHQAGGIPEPDPNTGGLMPCYFSWDWPESYATACQRASSILEWKPPKLGIRADDWPVMAKVAAMEPPKLSVLEGDRAAGEAIPRPSGAPSLRLVT